MNRIIKNPLGLMYTINLLSSSVAEHAVLSVQGVSEISTTIEIN